MLVTALLVGATSAAADAGVDSSDSDGWIVNYRFEFGDGNYANSSSPHHTYTYTYTLPGFYDTRLVVTDDDGAKDAESEQILVTQ